MSGDVRQALGPLPAAYGEWIAEQRAKGNGMSQSRADSVQALMDQAEDAAARDYEGMGVVFQLHITVVQITGINIHKIGTPFPVWRVSNSKAYLCEHNRLFRLSKLIVSLCPYFV